MTPENLPTPLALLFDMDGTLTKPMLDFDAIRDEIGIRGPILEAMRPMAGEELRRANAILDRHERDAAEASELNDGCREMLAIAAAANLPTALVTRNSRASVDIVLKKHALRFDVIVSREVEPPKPSPAPLRFACGVIGVDEKNAWMTGDGSHDIEAGMAAGMATIWISHGKPRTFAAQPTAVAETLHDVAQLLSSCRPARTH